MGNTGGKNLSQDSVKIMRGIVEVLYNSHRPLTGKEIFNILQEDYEKYKLKLSEIRQGNLSNFITLQQRGKYHFYSINKKVSIQDLLDLIGSRSQHRKDLLDKIYKETRELGTNMDIDDINGEVTPEETISVKKDHTKHSSKKQISDYILSDLRRVGRAYVGGKLSIGGVVIAVDLTVDLKEIPK